MRRAMNAIQDDCFVSLRNLETALGTISYCLLASSSLLAQFLPIHISKFALQATTFWTKQRHNLRVHNVYGSSSPSKTLNKRMGNMRKVHKDEETMYCLYVWMKSRKWLRQRFR